MVDGEDPAVLDARTKEQRNGTTRRSGSEREWPVTSLFVLIEFPAGARLLVIVLFIARSP